jgi:hypothetical protein
MENLLKNINEVNYLSTAAITSIGNLTIDAKYKVLRLDKVETKYGRSIVAYISRPEDELCRIYIPKKIVSHFDDCFIEQYNRNELGELYMTYKGTSQKTFNIVFD